MLAQVAGQYNEAGAALLDQARAGQIPDSAWSKIVTGLAGDQYEIGAPPPGIQSGLKTYHIQSGNQNFYSLPLGPGDQATQNLQLINQLLAATSSPVGRQALQNAQASLSGMASK
jgi:hypothetical protein